MRHQPLAPLRRRSLSLLLLAAWCATATAAAPLPAWLADAATGPVTTSDGVRLGECSTLRLADPHVSVAQWIDGQLYRWKELPQPDGTLCTLLVAPEARPLSATQAAALHDASRGGRVGSAIGVDRPSGVERRPVRSSTRVAEPSVNELDRSLDRAARRLLGESGATVRATLDRERADQPAGEAGRRAEPIVFGPDDRVRTADTTVFPYNTVVFVESEFPNGQFVFASGVLVSPYTVLTSALALYDPLLGGFAVSVLVVPGQTQTAEDVFPLIEPYGTRFGIEVEVPQTWIDDGDAASSYGAVFLEEAFAGIGTFYPIAFDLLPGGTVELVGYDESPQGESESFAQWRRTGTLVGSDELFVDHRMDDDFGAVGGPLATTGFNRRLFALNCCVADDDSSNVGVRFTSDIEDQITGWAEFEPIDDEPLDGPPLFVNQGRFRIVVNWRDFDGDRGAGQPEVLTGDTGYFTIFDPDNVEVVIKVLNACGVNQRYWVFAAGLTNLEIDLEVTDTLAQQTLRYRNRLGDDFQPILDTDAFATCP